MKYSLKLAAAFMAAAFFIHADAFAQECPCKLKPSETVWLYPEGQNSDLGVEGAQGPGESNCIPEKEYMTDWGFFYNTGDEARIDLYFPKKPNGQLMVVCPGGAYIFTSLINEGIYVADWMTRRGITVAVVKYRLPNGHWTVPLTDVQNTFRYCRAHASEWGINQIGVMGFSAGGHLAASASNLYVDEITRPDFSVLIYPVITMEEKLTHYGSRENLLGKDEFWNDQSRPAGEWLASRKKHQELIEHYSMEKQVTDKTPVTFLVHCTDDDCVPVENSLMYYEQLLAHKVPAEMHILPYGSHGWGFNLEKWVGEGKDAIGYARDEVMESLGRWLEMVRKGEIPRR